jgi:demethylmacrocin O-methyltransferase
MKEIGLKYDNDKITYHRYDLIYPTYIEKFKGKNIKMLEIGLGNYKDGTGYSRNMWKEYLINPEIFVMDIDYEFKDEIGEVIKGDQSNIEDIMRVGNICGSLDFIIDDGSHHPEHQLKTFEELFVKNLKNGGIYIIEDIECSYWRPNSEVYGYETGYLNIVDFFSKRLHQINSEFSLVNNEYNISTITFGKNCIIIKKQTDEELSLNNREYRFKNML